MRTGLLALPLLALGAEESPQPRLLSSPTIPYPRAARDLAVVGDALFVAHVNEQGKVTRVEVRTVPMRGLRFEEVVRDGVKKWRFAPAVVDGQPRRSEFPGRASFVLRARDEGAIAETVTRFADAWNGSDAAGFAATFEPDEAQVHTSIEPHVKGQAAIQAWATRRFATTRPLLVRKWAGLLFNGPDLATARVPVDGLDRDVYLKLTRKQGGWFVRGLEDALLVGPGALAARPRRVGEDGIVEPRVVFQEPPQFSHVPMQERVDGTVLLDCVITGDGDVTDVRVVSGPLWMRGPSVSAVQQWRYAPTIVDGVPVPVTMTVTVSFRRR
jgi:TonB family protein